MPHLIISSITIPFSFKGLHRAWCTYISYSLTISNILNVLTIFKHFMIIVSLDPDWGLGSDLFYTMWSILVAITGCSFFIIYYVNSPYDFTRYSYSMIC